MCGLPFRLASKDEQTYEKKSKTEQAGIEVGRIAYLAMAKLHLDFLQAVNGPDEVGHDFANRAFIQQLRCLSGRPKKVAIDTDDS
jgi:hypothetical protein